ncbi:MAG TPA: DUF192 domain-containing protein [Patescibacteria group bacterium]|nr:DUF192 domain-containing protein [Patescibacteria group bacterium]
MYKKILLILAVILVITAGLFAKKLARDPHTANNPTPCSFPVRITVGNASVDALYGATQAEREQGLSRKTSGESMLFDFRNESNKRPTFWMKDMNYNLDAIWIDKEKIVQIDRDIPKPSGTSPTPTIFRPTMDIEFILEVPAGFAEKYSIKVGDNFSFKKNICN